MPTDLPPDYRPKPMPDPEPQGDSVDGPGGVPQPGPNVGVPGPGADVVDPPGWAVPPLTPGEGGMGVPQPAGTPTF